MTAGYSSQSYEPREPSIVTLANVTDGITLSDFYAYMPQHSYIFTPSREMWPGASINARIPQIEVGTDENGEPVKITASAWLDQNKPVEQMTWCPGLPMLIEDRLVSGGHGSTLGC